MKNLIKFLINAKKNTYANGDATKVNSSRLCSKDYHYSEKIEDKQFAYHDTYFGGEKFIGEEVVYIDNKPYWAMNYYGNTINPDLSEEFMDNALRPALMKVGEDKNILPLRGPSQFVNEDSKYTFIVDGTLENFKGVEKIYIKDELVYELNCHGGIIK